jgi:hypothetical protein
VHHASTPRVWSAPTNDGDAWRLGMSICRSDEPRSSRLYHIGETYLELSVTGTGAMIDIDESGCPALSGYLIPDTARSLARWLLAVADQADPRRHGDPASST